MTEQELIEALADKEHSSWSRWMKYLFSKCIKNPDGSMAIPEELAQRWTDLSELPYSHLNETSKRLERDEVAHILPIIEAYKGKGTLDNATVDSLFDQAKLAMTVACLADHIQRLETEVLSTSVTTYNGALDTDKTRQTLLGRVNELSAMAALGSVDQSFFAE